MRDVDEFKQVFEKPDKCDLFKTIGNSNDNFQEPRTITYRLRSTNRNLLPQQLWHYKLQGRDTMYTFLHNVRSVMLRVNTKIELIAVNKSEITREKS